MLELKPLFDMWDKWLKEADEIRKATHPINEPVKWQENETLIKCCNDLHEALKKVVRQPDPKSELLNMTVNPDWEYIGHEIK